MKLLQPLPCGQRNARMFSTSASRFAQRSGYKCRKQSQWITGSICCFALVGLHSPKKGQKSYLVVRGLAVEIVGTPYAPQLCVVINLARGCYVCHCSRCWRNMSVGLTILVSVPFSGCEISKLFFQTQIAYNENIMYRVPNRTAGSLTLWQGSCFLIYKKVTNLKQLEK